MKSLNKEEGFFSSSDGTELFYRAWIVPAAKGKIILIHGLAEHSGRYGNFAEHFGALGWSLFILDLRGHGKSPGIRAHIDRLEIFLQDLHEFIQTIQENHPTGKTFLLGHSFGGQLAINFLVQYPKQVQGGILSSPNIRLAVNVPIVKRILGQYLSKLLPTLLMANEIDVRLISHDPQVVKAYAQDPLVSKQISMRMGSEILTNLKNIDDLAAKIKVPMLILHAQDDKITAPQGSQSFFDKLKIKDRQLIFYPGFYHEIFNELGKEKVFADLAAWLEARN